MLIPVLGNDKFSVNFSKVITMKYILLINVFSTAE